MFLWSPGSSHLPLVLATGGGEATWPPGVGWNLSVGLLSHETGLLKFSSVSSAILQATVGASKTHLSAVFVCLWQIHWELGLKLEPFAFPPKWHE